ncbi:MAG: helix-turn-helix transcriptional regulator [Clostridia bacterium]|nr:helix-turn-helix transcriptional regulator [Clostridia bacterium]
MNYTDLGHKVRILRRARRITQEELATQVGISASFLGHIERGTRVLSLDTLLALCDTLGVTPNDLLSVEAYAAQQQLPTDLTEKEQRQLKELISLYLKHIRE